MNKFKIAPFFFALLTSTIFMGCRTVNIPTGSHSQENTVILKSDTVHHLDSVFIEHWNTIIERGDTVYISKVEKEEKVKWRTRTHTDTFLVEKVDSVPYPVTVEKTVYVENPITGWSLLLNAVFIVFVFLFIWRKLHKRVVKLG